MNPPDSNKQEFGSLREGDTVMILKNNAKHHCYNGDIGALHFDEDVWGKHYAGSAAGLTAATLALLIAKRVTIWPCLTPAPSIRRRAAKQRPLLFIWVKRASA